MLIKIKPIVIRIVIEITILCDFSYAIDRPHDFKE